MLLMELWVQTPYKGRNSTRLFAVRCITHETGVNSRTHIVCMHAGYQALTVVSNQSPRGDSAQTGLFSRVTR